MEGFTYVLIFFLCCLCVELWAVVSQILEGPNFRAWKVRALFYIVDRWCYVWSLLGWEYPARVISPPTKRRLLDDINKL